MKIVLIHQNYPGQFKYLGPHLAAKPGNAVAAIGKTGRVAQPGIRLLTYRPKREPSPQTHPYLRRFEDAVLHGQEVARLLEGLKRESFVPDIIIGHHGWGETLFAKDVFPDVPILSYCEYYYRPHGGDVDFDPSSKPSLDDICRTRILNGHHLMAIEAADRGLAPTHWQRDQFPAAVRDKIAVVHDGIDIRTIKPDPDATFTLPDGTVLSRGDEVVTYVARNFEPHRGFATFMRAIGQSCRRRKRCHYLVVGGDAVSYGVKLAPGDTHRERMLAEVTVDPARVHFLGKVPYQTFLDVLRVSSAHVYLTQPFVLSWSVLEAMAAGCIVIASDTAPLREVIRHKQNGLLFDFFSPDQLADQIDAVLDARAEHAALGRAARATIVERYALADSLARLDQLIDSLVRRAPKGKPKFEERRRVGQEAAVMAS